MAMSLTLHASNKLNSLDYHTMRVEVVNFFPIRFDGDILFEFPLVNKPMGLPSKRKAWTKDTTDMLGAR